MLAFLNVTWNTATKKLNKNTVVENLIHKVPYSDNTLNSLSEIICTVKFGCLG